MRVLHLVTSLKVGGAERLASNLAAANPEDFVLATIVRPSDTGEIALPPGLAHLTLGQSHRFAWPLAVPALARLVRREGIQVVHSHLRYADMAAAQLAGDRIRLVTTLHGALWGKKRLNWLYRPIEQWTYGRFDAVAGCSRAVLTSFSSWVRYGGHTSVIPNGVDTDYWQFGLRPERQPATIAMVGNLYAVKGHELAFESAGELLRRGREFRLVLAGAGSLEGELRQMAGRASLPVEFLGSVSDVRQVYMDADILLFASSVEGLPMALLEGMATGLPVVTTAVGGIPEVVRDGEDGFLVPPGNAGLLADRLARLLDDAALRAGMGKSARARIVEQYSLRKTLQCYMDLYREICPQ